MIEYILNLQRQKNSIFRELEHMSGSVSESDKEFMRNYRRNARMLAHMSPTPRNRFGDEGPPQWEKRRLDMTDKPVRNLFVGFIYDNIHILYIYNVYWKTSLKHFLNV